MRSVIQEAGEEQCQATCEPIEECPPWSYPIVTETCFTCMMISEHGEHIQIVWEMGYSGNWTCDQAEPPADTQMISVHHRMEFDISNTDDIEGFSWLEWYDHQGERLCSSKFSASTIEIDQVCEHCDFTVGLSFTLRDLDREDTCSQVPQESREDWVEWMNGKYITLGYSKQWTHWDGQVHEDVIWWPDSYDDYYDMDWFPHRQARVEGDILIYEWITDVFYD